MILKKVYILCPSDHTDQLAIFSCVNILTFPVYSGNIFLLIFAHLLPYFWTFRSGCAIHTHHIIPGRPVLLSSMMSNALQKWYNSCKGEPGYV